jgi:hypothetical protein
MEAAFKGGQDSYRVVEQVVVVVVMIIRFNISA